jgi:hypothetical protein
VVESVSGVTKPSVPEFTVKFVDHSYDVPPTYSTDPYAGKNVMTQAGYHVENKSIEVTIKNQPFTSYYDENGSLVGLFYNTRAKGHFEDWTGEPGVENYIYRSDSDYTIIAYGLGGNNGSDVYSRRLDEISAGGQVDFQVQALIGYYTKIIHPPSPADVISGGQPGYHYVFTGEASSWSSTQTITIPASASSTTIQLLAIIGTAIAVVVVLGLLVYFKKRKRVVELNFNQPTKPIDCGIEFN